jgi:hypothetical protein
MNKKLDAFKGLDEADLALVSGGQSGAATALDIKRKQLQEQAGKVNITPPLKR